MADERLLRFDQGSKFTYTVKVLFDGAVVNITNWTARMQVRGDRRLTSPVLATFSSSGGSPRLVVLGPEALVLIDILGADTLGWGWDQGQYDLTIYEPSGEPHRILQGEIHVSHIVTASA